MMTDESAENGAIEEGDRGRELGYVETLCALNHDEAHGAYQVVSLAEVEGPLSAELVRLALRTLIARHPLLRVQLERSSSGYVFILSDRISRIPVQEQPWEQENDEPTVEEHAQAEAVDGRAELLGVSLFRDPDKERQRHLLVLRSHHAIADGISHEILVDELLRACMVALDGPVEDPRPRGLSPAIEERLTRSSSGAKAFAAHRAGTVRTPEAWPYAARAPAAARIPRICQRELPPSLLEAFHRRAKQEEVSINAGLAAAMLIAAARQTPESLVTSLTTSVNLRGYVTPAVPSSEVGCFISNVRTVHELEGTSSFWALARAYRRELTAQIALQTAAPASLHFSALAGRLAEDAIDGATEFRHRFGLSNLGTYRFAESHGPFALRRFRVTTSQRSGAYVGYLHAVTYRRRLDLAFCYTQPLLSTDWANLYMDQVVQAISSLSCEASY